MLYLSKMRNISLEANERKTLEDCYNNRPKSHVRKRAQSLLLSDEGWAVKQIASLHQTRTRTIYTWYDRWEKMGVGLLILSGRGLKPKLSITNEDLVKVVKKSRDIFKKPPTLCQRLR